MMVVSPVVILVESTALSPPSPSVAVLRGSGVWVLTLLMFIVATFVFPPPRSNFATKKVLRLPNSVAFGSIFCLKDSANKNSGFLVRYVAPRELVR